MGRQGLRPGSENWAGPWDRWLGLRCWCFYFLWLLLKKTTTITTTATSKGGGGGAGSALEK